MDRREIRQSFSRLVIDRRGWDFSKSSQEVWHCFETSADLFPVVLSFCRIGHWCRSHLVRRNVNWWRRRSRDCVRPYRRCVVALCLWARSWTTFRRIWTPCRTNCRPGAKRTRRTHRLCYRNKGAHAY